MAVLDRSVPPLQGLVCMQPTETQGVALGCRISAFQAANAYLGAIGAGCGNRYAGRHRLEINVSNESLRVGRRDWQVFVVCISAVTVWLVTLIVAPAESVLRCNILAKYSNHNRLRFQSALGVLGGLPWWHSLLTRVLRRKTRGGQARPLTGVPHALRPSTNSYSISV